MRRDRLDPAAAEVAYDIIEREAGASLAEREDFVRYVSERGLQEWRFCGLLGFGGKIRLRDWPEPTLYVDCYPEHLNDERKAIIARVNHELSKVLGPPPLSSASDGPGDDRAA